MIAVLFLIVLAAFFGWTISRALDSTLPPGMQAGVAFLLGLGSIALVLWLLSIIHLRWNLWLLLLIIAVVGALCLRRAARYDAAASLTLRGSRLSRTLDLLIVVIIAGYAVYATLASPWEWDFWSIWGLKGRIFWSARAIDWRFLTDHEHLFAHVDYPLLLPLTFDAAALIRGAWDDRWLGLLYVAFAAATLLVLRDAVAEDHGPVAGSLAALALVGTCCSLWIGLAEGPLIAYGSTGLLLIRRSLQKTNEISMSGSLLLAYAALTKNEGLTLFLATILALVLARQRRLFPMRPMLIPTAAVLLWLALRLMLRLQALDFERRALSRTLENLGGFLTTLTSVNPHHPMLWVLFGIVLLTGGALFYAREQFLVTVLILQIAACSSVYLVSRRELGWLVRSSWPRVSSQLELLIGFVVVSFLLDRFLKTSMTAAPRAGAQITGGETASTSI